MKNSKKQSIQVSDEYQPPLSTYYKSNTNKKSAKGRLKSLSIGLGILIIIVALGGGGYLLYKHHKPPKVINKSIGSTSASPATNSKIVTSTTKYVSNGNDLNLSFMYPSNWTVTPASNNNPNDHPITASSPLSTIPTSSGKSVVGKVVVQVLATGTNISQLNSSTSVAATASTQFAYTSPTANQDQYPYLTFVNLSTTLTTNIPFQMAVITGGDEPFTQAEQVNNEALSGLDPIVYTVFYQCLDESCVGSKAVPLSVTSSIWQSTPIFKQDQALLLSFEFN